jgi:2-oxoglutarate ferredoxin oxidoreductase subunit beta
MAWGDRIPIGIIYEQERPVYEDNLSQLKDLPLVKQPIEPTKIEKLLDEFSYSSTLTISTPS